MRIDLPPYAPDQSLNSGLVVVAENVIRSIDGYRPIGAFLPNSSALPDSFAGGSAFISTQGSAYLIAGTESGLYRYSSGNWDTLLDGMSIVSHWRFAQFGDHVVAVNGGPTQAIDLAGATTGPLANAPVGTSIAVVGDHVVIGQADADTLLVKWSAFNDHTEWTPAVNQAGFQPMLTGGAVMGIAGGEFGIILQRDRLVRMSRTGDSSAPFVFDEITPNIGCASTGSIAQAGRSVFFLSDRGFMACEDGQIPVPIGNEKIDRTFIADVPRDDWARICCAIDPRNTLVFWFLPGAPGKGWLYNWTLSEWSTVSLPVDGCFAGFTSSTDIDHIGITDIDADPTITLDDPRWSGGAPRLFVVQGGRIGTLEGLPLRARIHTGLIELAQGRVSYIRSFSPIGDLTKATASLDARARLGDSERIVNCAPLRPSGIMPVRTNGRYVAAKLTIPEGHGWRFMRAFDIELSAGAAR